MARKVRVRRTQAAIAEANAITAAARAADAELYRAECSVCSRTIPKEIVLSGQSTRTTCGGRFSMRRRSWLRRWRCWPVELPFRNNQGHFLKRSSIAVSGANDG